MIYIYKRNHAPLDNLTGNDTLFGVQETMRFLTSLGLLSYK